MDTLYPLTKFGLLAAATITIAGSQPFRAKKWILGFLAYRLISFIEIAIDRIFHSRTDPLSDASLLLIADYFQKAIVFLEPLAWLLLLGFISTYRDPKRPGPSSLSPSGGR
jgi:hypothetical protein